MIFDTHIIVDGSARSAPSPARPAKDAIWWCAATDGVARSPEYARTRHQAIDRLAAVLAAELDADRRTLIGFDFPFGYPAGVARDLTGRASAFALWDWLDDRIRDTKDNANNRYEVAQVNWRPDRPARPTGAVVRWRCVSHRRRTSHC